MKCPNCNSDILIQIGTRIKSKGCQILTTMTIVLTAQCDKCKTIFQVPVPGKKLLSIKEDNEESE